MNYFISTKTGDREINEDSVWAGINEDSGLFALADGLGGHGRGEVASAMLTETAAELYREKGPADSLIADILEEAQKRILDRQIRENAQREMKTTAVILLIKKDVIQWGHIGDSRLYFFKKNKLIKRTLDHSVPQMLVNAGDIKESKIRNHPDRNRLLKVMGMEWDKPAYVIGEPIPREGGEAFLLCSDGFWENVLEKEMLKLLKKSKEAADWIAAMDPIVQKRGKGKMDNNSAIAVLL